MLLTLSISTTKKASYTRLYLCLLEYYIYSKDLKPFLEKFVKGKEEFPYENEKIKEWKEELTALWTEEIGSDTAKALVGTVVKEVKSILTKWKNLEHFLSVKSSTFLNDNCQMTCKKSIRSIVLSGYFEGLPFLEVLK